MDNKGAVFRVSLLTDAVVKADPDGVGDAIVKDDVGEVALDVAHLGGGEGASHVAVHALATPLIIIIRTHPPPSAATVVSTSSGWSAMMTSSSSTVLSLYIHTHTSTACQIASLRAFSLIVHSILVMSIALMFKKVNVLR